MASVYRENEVMRGDLRMWGHKIPSSQLLPGFVFREVGQFLILVSTVGCFPLTSQFAFKLCQAGTQKQHPTLNLLLCFS